MSIKRCYNCMHNEYCYACSIAFPERAESCAAYNAPEKKDCIDKYILRKQLGGK